MSARDDILARVRAALGPSPAVPDVPRAYHQAGFHPRGEAVERFCERAAEYRANVRQVSSAGLAEALVEALGDARDIATPPGLAELGYRVDDPPLPVAELDRLDAIVTGCALAIADTGTIVLDGGELSGRRALTLVPDHHVCLVRAETIVPSVPDAIAALDPARPITFVSGPSATSDIELDRVEGVHGPRRLDIIVVG